MAKLTLGHLVATRGVADTINEHPDFLTFVWDCIHRYLEADWGDMSKEDMASNDKALATGEDRIFAAYKHPEHESWKIWIITEWDRSATTVLFPDEY